MGGLGFLALLIAAVGVIMLVVRSNRFGDRLIRIESDNQRLTQALKLVEQNLTRLEQLYTALLTARHQSSQAQTSPTGEAPPNPVPEPPRAAEPASARFPIERAFEASPLPSSPTAPVVPAPPGIGAAEELEAAPMIAPAPAQAKKFEWERVIGVNLPVWIGAIALALGGFFFAVWAIENKIFNPNPVVRVIGALLLGLALLAAAEFVRRRVKRDNGPAIAAALASAGIATLYATAYIASVFYTLVPESFGFLGMALVTAIAIAIALRFGQIVAVVGLLGGYLAPVWYAGAEPSAFILFSYLTAILIAMFAVIRLRNWWTIALPALLGPAIWVVAWSFSPVLVEQHIWASGFVLAISVVVAVAGLPAWIANTNTLFLGDDARVPAGMKLAVLASFALTTFGFLVFLRNSNFAIPFWQAHIVFAVLTVALAFVWPWSMRLLPFLPLAASVLALLTWVSGSNPGLAYVTASLAAIFAMWSLDQMRRLREPAIWSIVVAALALFFFAVALFRVAGWEAVLANRHLWALAAIALAAAMLGLIRYFAPKLGEQIQRDGVYAAFGAATTAFISLVVIIELDPVLFPAAAALEVVGLAAIYSRVPVPALRVLAGILTVIYLALVVGAGLGISGGNDPLRFALARSLSEAPLLLLIVPGLAFFAAATLLRPRGATVASALADTLDIAAVAMLAIGLVYQLLPQDIPFTDTHIAAAKILTPELILCLVAVVGGNWLGRPILYRAGVILTVLIEAAMVLALMLPAYFFWPRLNLPGAPVFNIALLSLGLPSLLLLGLGWTIRQDRNLMVMYTGRTISVVAAFLLFTLMLLDIRHAFHPAMLQGPMSEAEFYAYSIGMLAFGIILLIGGIALRNLGARILSLVFIVTATLKVFLFDASALEGLWRVLSFFGMGLAFLAISWFYARYVFGIRRKEPAPPAEAPAS